MCVLTGYGGGATGYLGAVPGNGFGKRKLLSTCTEKNKLYQSN